MIVFIRGSDEREALLIGNGEDDPFVPITKARLMAADLDLEVKF